MPSAAITLVLYAGLAVAAFVNILLMYGRRRFTTPKGRHQHRD